MIECLIAVIVLIYIAGAGLMACFIKYNDLDPRSFEIIFWPVVVFISYVEATHAQIKRAIKERKNGK